MAKALTDSMVANLKSKRGQAGWVDMADGAVRGLCLRMGPRGEKSWAVRHVIAGKRRRHTIGAYPEVSLSAARERARDYLAAAKEGVTPGAVDDRRRALTMTLEEAHDEYLKTIGPGLRANTLALKKAMFRDHIAPVLGTRLVRKVRRPDITEVVDKVVAKGLLVQANRVFSELMALLRWCEQKGYIDGVPSIRKRDLRSRGAAREKPRCRTLTDAEVREVWRAAENLGQRTRDYLRVLLLVGQRRDEVRLMRWSEIDLEQGLWTIPGARYKTGRDHVVPLAAPVIDILRRRLADHAGEPYVFAGRKRGKPFNGTLSAQRRLRKKMTHRAPFTLHDFRRTVRTGLSRLGVDEETGELAIGHVLQGMAKVYDLHDRLVERRNAFERWAAFVCCLGADDDKVVPMQRAS